MHISVRIQSSASLPWLERRCSDGKTSVNRQSVVFSSAVCVQQQRVRTSHWNTPQEYAVTASIAGCDGPAHVTLMFVLDTFNVCNRLQGDKGLSTSNMRMRTSLVRWFVLQGTECLGIMLGRTTVEQDIAHDLHAHLHLRILELHGNGNVLLLILLLQEAGDTQNLHAHTQALWPASSC